MALTPVSRTGRKMRKPKHPFFVEHRPFLLCPFMIAPVLPGETMKNLLMQSRVVSNPINSPLIGWWLEYYWFYVKLRDLSDRENYTKMLIDPNFDQTTLANYSASDNTAHYFAAGGIDWIDACLERVYDEFFINQDTDDAYSAATKIDGLPVVSINNSDFTDSLLLDADYSVPDVNVDLDASGTVTASEVEQALRNYNWLRMNGLTEVTYEEYLRTFGMRPPKDDPHIPELIRYVREWSYPTNTINPVDGAPSSALSWSIAERADKDRFFREPGFILGLTTARPKVYLSKQRGSMSSFLDGALEWLPAMLRYDPQTSMKKFAATAGPLDNTSTAYWLDCRDLFVYGEQFTNVLSTDTGVNWAALPDTAGKRRYPAAADINGLFKSATVNKVRHDGVVTLSILGAEQDYSATTQGELRSDTSMRFEG